MSFDDIPYVFLAGKKGATSGEKDKCSDEEAVLMGAETLLLIATSTPNTPTCSDLDCDVKRCQLCNTIKTPLWRRTTQYHTLCNACGIRQKNLIKKHSFGCKTLCY